MPGTGGGFSTSFTGSVWPLTAKPIIRPFFLSYLTMYLRGCDATTGDTKKPKCLKTGQVIPPSFSFFRFISLFLLIKNQEKHSWKEKEFLTYKQVSFLCQKELEGKTHAPFPRLLEFSVIIIAACAAKGISGTNLFCTHHFSLFQLQFLSVSVVHKNKWKTWGHALRWKISLCFPMRSKQTS